MKNLHKYAEFLANIRQFFARDGVMEVETHSLLNYPTLDNNIDSIKIITNPKFQQQEYYLHTSPEIEMKRLLALNNFDMYQICKVYRDNEIGEKNFNEFSMLEYYRLGMNELGLSENVIKLLHAVGIGGEVFKFSYKELFLKFAGVDISQSFTELKAFAKSHNLTTDFDNLTDLQIFLFVHFVEGHLADFPICVIYDFPKEQSALARVEGSVSKRFEVYIEGVEVANGYDELTTFSQYQERFLEQSGGREIDTEFLEILKKNPLPRCAGVALGLGRIFNFV